MIMNPQDKIIFALDTHAQQAIARAHVVREAAGINFVKVGWQAFISGGLDLVKKLDNDGFNIFLDLKLDDTPNTIVRALGEIPPMRGLRYISMQGDIDSVKAARMNVPTGTQIVHVPYLSSQKLGIFWSSRVKDAVRPLLRECKTFVASGFSINVLQRTFPGITIIGVGASDKVLTDNRGHNKVFPAEQLINWGADYVVVGRPIMQGAADGLGQRAVDFISSLT